jgi:hypothetical protein
MWDPAQPSLLNRHHWPTSLPLFRQPSVWAKISNMEYFGGFNPSGAPKTWCGLQLVNV